MKTITLHIGPAKTGTTTIQKTLAANSEALERRGLLYPLDGPRHARDTIWGIGDHRWLSLLILPDRKRWPRKYKSGFSEADKPSAVSHAQKRLSRLFDTIRRTDAQRIVLSSEYLGGLDRDAVQRLKALFDPIDAKLEILCYYRNPAKGYLSALQQNLRTGCHLLDPGKVLRPILPMYENYVAAFGDAVSVRLFDRAHLKHGDVVADILSALGVDDQTIASISVQDENTSSPAERTAAQYWIRSRAFQDLDEAFTHENRCLNLALERAGEGLDLNRLALQPDVGAYILHRNREDLQWLKTHLGLTFNDIDYDSLDAPPQLDLKDADLPDLIQYDSEKTDLLIARSIRILCKPTTALARKEKPLSRRILLAWKQLVRN